jgi:hypothetical protein
MFVYLNRYGKNRFNIIYFFTVQHSSVYYYYYYYYYYYWPAAFSVHIDTLTLCCAHSMTTYGGESNIIRTVGTRFAVGYTAGWAWQIHMAYSSPTIVVQVWPW